jgi:hypothetical protein
VECKSERAGASNGQGAGVTRVGENEGRRFQGRKGWGRGKRGGLAEGPAPRPPLLIRRVEVLPGNLLAGWGSIHSQG